MAYKPVGADENGKFPPRVETALAATFAAKSDLVSAAEPLVASLDMREARALTVALAGDSTGDSHLEWFELSWRLSMRDVWPERPARLYSWDNTTSAHGAVEPWQAGNGVLPMFTAYNGSVAGSTLDAQRTYMAAMFPVKPDLLMISHGHNYTVDAPAYLADLDLFVEQFHATYPGVPVACLSQNPQFTTGAKTQPQVDQHAARMLALRDHCKDRGWGYVPTWEAFSQRSGSGASLINVDGVHPTPAVTSEAVLTGGRLQADVARTWIESQSLRKPSKLVTDIGVPGYDHLYTADRLVSAGTEPAATTAVHFWWDQGAPHESIADAAGTTAGAVVTEETGHRFLRIDTPPASAMGAAWANPSTNPRTMAYVFRSATLTVYYLQAVGYRIRRITGGAWEMSNGTDVLTIAGTDSWTFLMAVHDGANSVFRVNATEVVASTAFAPGAIGTTGITLGTGSGTDRAPFDFAAVASWPRALTSAERATVHSVMKARYPVLT